MQPQLPGEPGLVGLTRKKVEEGVQANFGVHQWPPDFVK